MQSKLVGLTFAALLAGNASAWIVNGNFETPAYGNGGFTDGLPGWTKAGEAGHWNIFPGYGFFNSEAPAGTQIFYGNGTSIAQQTAAELLVGTSTLSVMAGRRADTFAASFRMELYAGGTVDSGNVTGGVLLKAVNFDHTSIAPSSFVPLTLEYTADATDANLGKLLSVRFFKTTGVQMNFDQVQLNPVPEPGTMIALAAGLGLLARRRRAAQS